MGNRTGKQITGEIGEDIACRWLASRGHSIFTRNYWKPWGEIDIVTRKDGVVHFVEVKSVTRETFEDGGGHRPEDNVHPAKLKRMARVIQTYLAQYPTSLWQFDVVTVKLSKRAHEAKVDILENVVLEG
jgi:putative endonuclease